MRYLSTFFLCFFYYLALFSQNYSFKYSVQLWATVQNNPPKITLNWINDSDATAYTIFRKTKTATSWGGAVASLPKDSTRFVDNNVEAGKAYEYRVSRSSSSVPGTGYMYSSILMPANEWNGTILLLVENSVSTPLQNEIDRWKNDVRNEGWNPISIVVDPSLSVVDIRKTIVDMQKIHPDLRSVFILGHVKVPYSGNIAPDGHGDHVGAWPADCYYADLDGIWTDVLVDNTTASRAENKNVPGDGKFDQSTIASNLELEVGRVDFFNMPEFTKSEVELLRAYLDKNHLWRTGMIQSERRGIVQDNFNFPQEGFGQSGVKNFSTFFGPQNVVYGTYRDSLLKKPYLWSYGAGGGSYTSASGISTTANMAKDSLQSIFTFLFGSYFGDWDSRNNFLRSSLGSGTILATAWSGRPLWAMHHMAMGEHIGYSAKLSMNNSSTYSTGVAPRSVHQGLLGDPSLVMFPYTALKGLQLVESGPHIDMVWNKHPEATMGYTIYRRIEGNTLYDILARNHTDTTYRDQCLQPGFNYEYIVRASKIESTASGNYYNLSPGANGKISKTEPVAPQANFNYTIDYEFIHLKSNSKNTNNVKWIIGTDTLSSNEIDYVFDCKTKSVRVCLLAEGECDNDLFCQTISYECSVPEITGIKVDSILCKGDKASIEILDVAGADPFLFKWSNGSSMTTLRNLEPGLYQLTITSDKNTESIYQFNFEEPDSLLASFKVRGATPGNNDGGVEDLLITGGTPPYRILQPAANTDSLAQGDYTLIIEDAHGCLFSKTFRVGMRTSNQDDINEHGLYLKPVPAKDYIEIHNTKGLKFNSIQLIDIGGKTIRNCDPNQTRVNVQDLPAGWYGLKIEWAKSGYRILGFNKI